MPTLLNTGVQRRRTVRVDVSPIAHPCGASALYRLKIWPIRYAEYPMLSAMSLALLSRGAITESATNCVRAVTWLPGSAARAPPPPGGLPGVGVVPCDHLTTAMPKSVLFSMSVSARQWSVDSFGAWSYWATTSRFCLRSPDLLVRSRIKCA